MTYTVHPSAIVDEGAQIGDGSRVWHFAHVCAEAKISRNVSLAQNAFVGNKAIIADNCKIQNNVSVPHNIIWRLIDEVTDEADQCLSLKSLELLLAKHHSARDRGYVSLRLKA